MPNFDCHACRGEFRANLLSQCPYCHSWNTRPKTDFKIERVQIIGRKNLDKGSAWTAIVFYSNGQVEHFSQYENLFEQGKGIWFSDALFTPSGKPAFINPTGTRNEKTERAGTQIESRLNQEVLNSQKGETNG